MKKILLVSFTFLFFYVSYAQEDYFENSIWLKGDVMDKELKQETFNYHNIISLDELDGFNNALKNKATFFIVFKSNTKDEKVIADLSYSNKKIRITNQGIFKDGYEEYEFLDSDFGKIISYSFNDPSVALGAKNKMLLKALELKKQDSLQFLEFLYLPRELSRVEIRKIETYLSIKWGISLTPESSYVNFKGDTIWDSQKNKGFNNRITGVGLNILPKVNQLKSKNSQETGFLIEFDSIYLQKATKDTQLLHLLIGDDNGKQVWLRRNEKQYDLFEKSWKVIHAQNKSNASFDSIFVNLSIRKNEVETQAVEDKELYLVYFKDINDFETKSISELESYPAIVTDSLTYTFKGVKISNQEGYFKLVRTQQFEVTINESTVCNEVASYTFSIQGGISPYSVYFENIDSKSKLPVFETDEREFYKDFNEPGKYLVTLKDSSGSTIIDTIRAKKLDFKIDNLPEQLTIYKNQYKTINPDIIIEGDNIEDDSSLSYQWYQENELISEMESIYIHEAGEYFLKVTDENCSCEFPFSVLVKDEHDKGSKNIFLSPNPVVSGDNFNLFFRLDEASDVDIGIFDIYGKKLLDKSYSKATNISYSNSFNVSGTYIMSVLLNGKIEKNFKLIVK